LGPGGLVGEEERGGLRRGIRQAPEREEAGKEQGAAISGGIREQEGWAEEEAIWLPTGDVDARKGEGYARGRVVCRIGKRRGLAQLRTAKLYA
jgi:hypothetical protein